MTDALPKLPLILLTGASGQIGFELQRSLAMISRVVTADRQVCDLRNPERVRTLVRDVQPQLIVNAAAYTAVDKAEAEGDEAHAVNADAVQVLAEEAHKLGAALLHYSTDYVFDGEQTEAYNEAAPTRPINAYGASKLSGEQAIRNAMQGGNWWVLRTSWVYGLHGQNFIKTMLRLAGARDTLSVVADQVGAPTGAALIADVTALLLRLRPASGLYHLAASGSISWHGYAQHIIVRAQEAGAVLKVSAAAVTPIATSDYPTAARRPLSSRLNCDKLQAALGIVLPEWTHGVNQAVDLLVENRTS